MELVHLYHRHTVGQPRVNINILMFYQLHLHSVGFLIKNESNVKIQMECNCEHDYMGQQAGKILEVKTDICGEK